MRKYLVAAAMAVGVLSPAAASAATWDAFTSFAGLNGPNGQFIYFGLGNGTGPATVGLVAQAPGACPLDSVCILSANPGITEGGVYKATASTPTSFSPGPGETVLLPKDMLVINPDTTGVGIGFIAPATGTYRFDFAATALSNLANGIGIGAFAGGSGSAVTPPDQVLSNFAYSTQVQLTGGQAAGFIINRGSLVDHDQTGVNFTVSTVAQTAPVPEPAAWALMIGGFGMAGAMLRTRRSLAA